MVAVAGPIASPAVLDRKIVHLVKTFTYTFRQPYHTAAKMPIEEAAEFIKSARMEAQKLALVALRHLQKELEKVDLKISGCGLLLASGRPLPELEKILASHALIHTADGELFRDAIRDSCAKCHSPVVAIKEREIFDAASGALRLKPEILRGRIAAMGKPLGPPWSQDEKLSALAAWISLAG
jgi:hypothetical protein